MLTWPSPPSHPADQRHREAVDPSSDPGDVHEVAGENEERHGKQGETLHAGDHALGENHVGRDTRGQDVEQ